MRQLQQFITEAEDVKYMNKSLLYLLSIPFEMYKNYNQYSNDFGKVSDDELEDLKSMQDYFNSLEDNDRVRVKFSTMDGRIKNGIKIVCNICLKHKEDFSKLDIFLMSKILKEIE